MDTTVVFFPGDTAYDHGYEGDRFDFVPVGEIPFGTTGWEYIILNNEDVPLKFKMYLVCFDNP